MAIKKVKYEDNLAPEVRRKSIGGSEIAIVMGDKIATKYKSIIDLWLEKTGQKEPDDLSENEDVFMGKFLEDKIAELFTIKTGKKIRKNNFVLYHPVYKFLSANLDREVIGEDAILECKNTGSYNLKEWDNGQDDVPQRYLYQVMQYLMITGKRYGYFSALIGGNRHRWKCIERDDELIAEMIKRAKEFWQCVETNTMPEVTDYSTLNSETVKALYPESKAGTSIQLPYSEITVDTILQYKQIIKDHQEFLDSLENELKMELQDNEMATVGEKYIVTYKTIESERFDSKKLKQDMPEVANKYIKTSSYRKLSIKEIGE